MQSPVSTSRRLAFGTFEADLHSGELRKDGVRLRLQAQPFQLLVMLLERPGELVTREEICQKLWSTDTFVDFDRSLGTAVNKIREVLEDSATEPRFVETLPRRGYRFIAPVTPVAEPPQDVASPVPLRPTSNKKEEGHRSPFSRRIVWIGACVVLVVSALVAWYLLHPHPIRSIAVLPLASLSTDPSEQFLAYGVTDELTMNLARDQFAPGEFTYIVHCLLWYPKACFPDGALPGCREPGGGFGCESRRPGPPDGSAHRCCF